MTEKDRNASSMKFAKGKITLDIDIIAPQEKLFQNKYMIGTQLLLKMKNRLIGSGDLDYYRFLLIYAQLGESTLLDFDRAYMLYQLARSTEHLGECTAECGVYRGGGSILIAGHDSTRNHFAMDTFEGFPDEISTIDVHGCGGFSDVCMSDIHRLFADFPSISILKGPFNESFQSISERRFSFVHVDADLYESTRQCLEFFHPRMVSGGIMLFDDYLIPDTPGVKKAVDGFFRDVPECPIVLPAFQVMVIKN